jgi:hypothetical protein
MEDIRSSYIKEQDPRVANMLGKREEGKAGISIQLDCIKVGVIPLCMRIKDRNAAVVCESIGIEVEKNHSL